MIDGVLVDARTRHAAGRILRELRGHQVVEHALTHAHADHVAFWRERDRVLLAGDAFFNRSPVLGLAGLHEPPSLSTPDPEQNRALARRLAALRPRVACFGHGPVLRGPGRLADFAAGLAGGSR